MRSSIKLPRLWFLAIIFFGNTPRDSNPWDILNPEPLTQDVEGTCTMFVVRKTLCGFQIPSITNWAGIEWVKMPPLAAVQLSYG